MFPYASFGMRAKALLIDVALLVGICFLLFVLITLTVEFHYNGDEWSKAVISIVSSLAITYISAIFYFTYMDWKYGASVGKKICKLTVLTKTLQRPSLGCCLVRTLLKVFFLSYFSCFGIIFFIPVLFNSRKQTVYDLLVNTLVIHHS